MTDENVGLAGYDHLDAKTLEKLKTYQLDHLNREVIDYLNLNEAAERHVFKFCPKCGKEVNNFKRGGYTYVVNHNGEKVRSKALLKCPICGHRFTLSHGQLPFYSHSGSDVWAKVIEDTIKGVPIIETAAETNKNPSTVFRMRHKFLEFITASNDEIKIVRPCEADEKYIYECHKGLVDATIDEDNKIIIVNRRPKRESIKYLSEKVCLGTVIEREGKSCIEPICTGGPKKADLKKICSHINRDTFTWTDRKAGYKDVLTELGCPFKQIESGNNNQIDHLNTVNNLHSRIGEWLSRYRNVNSIYLYRYCALFALRQRTTGMDLYEIAVKLIVWLKQRNQYFTVKDMHKHIFNDPTIMNARKSKLAWTTISRLKKEYGYKICAN